MREKYLNHKGAKYTKRTLFFVSLWFICLAACVPATTPPQLTHTPGQPVTITDESFDNGVFSLRYPRDWRVVTGAAASPPSVTLIMPEDCGFMIVSSERITNVPPLPPQCGADMPELRRHFDEVWIVGKVAPRDEGVFMTLFERVLASVQPAAS